MKRFNFKKIINRAMIFIKLLLMWLVLNIFRRDLYKKNIWIIREKAPEARDNGYHFFKYMREHHPEENVYYAITLDSVDLCKISNYGNIIKMDSLKHYLYYLAAKYSINSQQFGASPSPERFIYRFRYLCRKNQKVVFLQHGIIKDELSHNLDYDTAHFDLFCCGAERECEFIKKVFGYPDKNAQALGLCRFDNLTVHKEDKKRQILVMPTFRTWLKSSNSLREATQKEKNTFENSEYFKTYTGLLSSHKMLELLKKENYKIVFYPHYAMQPFIHCFDRFANDAVIIADRMHYDVQQLLIDSAVMITDFSSVFFDFAYMEKPEIFFQFDEEQYRSGHYKEGYFSYEKDAFGPKLTSIDEVIDELEKILMNNAKVEERYLKRIDNFFSVRDDKNCERTYNAILNLE